MPNALLRFSLLALMTAALCRCGPMRPPVRPGTIPAYQRSTTADRGYGIRVYKELRAEYPELHDAAQSARVESIMTNLSRAAQAGDADWQVHIFRDDYTVNAAATRGEQLFLWSGLLKLVRDDHELAAVMAHEMAHFLAGHTSATPQEEARRIVVDAGQTATQSVLGSQGYMGVGTGLAGQMASRLLGAALLNPESQRQEYEADHIGLFMAARAGYNPERMILFWERMGREAELSNLGLGFLSTHPASRERAAKLRTYLPAAMRLYQENPVNDSFNVGREDSFNIAPSSSRPPDDAGSSPSVWIVQEEWTAVHQDPDESSRVVSHLFYNQAALVERVDEKWLRITKPVRGWVKGRDLAPKQ
jgi:metalloendopeptidase OMA1, mitochondrial